MMNYDAYTEWFVKCIKCEVCKDFVYSKNDGRKKGFICNDNIVKDRNNRGIYPIRPQAGCVDRQKWFKDPNVIRILLLGMNPRGGYGDNNRNKNKDEDPELYKIYNDIINNHDSKNVVSENMGKIMGQVAYYNPTVLQSEIAKIFSEEKKKEVSFAYANQILCRTIPEAGKISGKASFPDVYQNCFDNRIKHLLETLSPDYVIALGITWKWQFDKYFQDDLKYMIVRHPSHGGKNEALRQIKAKISQK